eukprot:COSAG01_NODE_20674_length_940_cov_24.127229_2_plen_47_part_00
MSSPCWHGRQWLLSQQIYYRQGLTEPLWTSHGGLISQEMPHELRAP